MESVDWGAIARYVPEILLVVIFMAYTYISGKDLSAERIERAKTNADERKERDSSWQKFLQEERDARTTWASQAANQMTQMASLITATNLLITQHDTWQRAYNERKENKS